MSPSLNKLLSIAYLDDISCLPPSMSCWVLHTRMTFHISLPQWVVDCYIPRWYFMSPSLNELLSITYLDDISHSPQSMNCWVLHIHMEFHVSLPQLGVKCYILGWYFMSPSFSELLRITYPCDISCLPPSVNCWVLHTQMIFYVSLPQ